MKCPEWCTVTHDDHAVQAHETRPMRPDRAAVSTYVCQWEHRGYRPEPPTVRIFASQGGTTTGMDLNGHDARVIAQVVENLGHGTAADHQAFADALRANAALIDPQPEPEAEAG